MAQTSKNPTQTARSTFPLSLFANNWPFAPWNHPQMCDNSIKTSGQRHGVILSELRLAWCVASPSRQHLAASCDDTCIFFICARKSRVAGERWKVPGQTAGRPSPGDVCPPPPSCAPPTPPRTCAIDEWHCCSSWSALTGFACEVEASFPGDISEAK